MTTLTEGRAPAFPEIIGNFYTRAHSMRNKNHIFGTAIKLDVMENFTQSTATRDLFAVANILVKSRLKTFLFA